MSHARLLPATLAAALLVAAPAAAAPAVGNPVAKPVSPAAGAHSDVTVSFDVTGLGAVGAGGDDLKSLKLDLPAGLAGNPRATGGTCTKAQLTADSCPATTKVGTTETTASIGVDPLTTTLTLTGDIYNETPGPGEAARLGIVLRPPVGDKVVLESPIHVRAADGGLTSTVDNVPNTAGGMDLRIDKMKLTLLGKLASGKAFMSNPTSCAPATSTITIGTYNKATATGTAGFTPTACEALPFAPQVTASLGATRDDMRKGGRPSLTVTVTQQPGEANAKSVTVALPTGIGADLTALNNACPVATYQAGTCPANAVVGSGTAISPFLAEPLTGPVTLVSDPSAALPQLRIALRGAFPVDLVANVGFGAGGRLVNTIDGIYDVPISSFALTIAGGVTSPLAAGADLCVPGTTDLEGTFVAHSGTQATAKATAATVGCDAVGPTKLAARIGRLAGGRPALRFKAANADRALDLIKLSLPKGLTFTKRAKALTVAKVTGRGVYPTVRLRKGVLEVAISSGGSQTVDVLLGRGAIRVSKKLRRAKFPKLKLRAQTRLAGQPPTSRSVWLLVRAKV
jgi:hypothetical protein